METMGTTVNLNVAQFNRLEHSLVGFLYLLFCVVGISLNLITAIVFYKDTKLVSKPWLHICLAIANMGVVAPSPLPASSSFSGRWLYGSGMCQIYAFEGMFVGITAISFVVAMCIERYVVGDKARSEETGWFYVGTVIVTLTNAFFWAAMPLLGWTKYDLDPAGTSCALIWKDPDDGFVSYILTLEIFSFGVPLAIAAFCLYRKPDTPPTEPNPPPDASTETNLKPITEDHLQKVCYVFLLLVMVGWGPFAVVCTMVLVTPASQMSMLASVIPPLACKVMVSAYPATYAVISPRFRHSWCSLFSKTGRKEQ